MAEGRLSNAEFARCLSSLLEGRRLPPDIPAEDAADLALARRIHDLRRTPPRLAFGNLALQEEILRLLTPLSKLRPVERQVLTFHLSAGYSLAVVARLTGRAETNAITSLRSGLRTLRGHVEKASA